MKSEVEKLLERAWGVKPLSFKNNYNFKTNNQNPSKPKSENGANIIVKVTGGAKGKAQARYNLDYDLQKDTRIIYDEDGREITKEDVQDWLDDEFLENRKNSKATYRLVFSMSENIDKDILLKAVQMTIKELFPHNQKYFVLHDNTDNNHVHVTIGKTSYDSKNHTRLHIDKKKLVKIKQKYKANLQFLGIKNARLLETRNIDQEIKKSFAYGNKNKVDDRSQRLRLHNTHRIINFGFNHFKNDPTKKISPFVELESLSKNNRILWDHKLFNQLKEKNIKPDDLIQIKKNKDGSSTIIKVDSDPFDIKLTIDKLFEFGRIISVETKAKEKELLIQFESKNGVELITKRGKEAKDLLNIKNELIGKNIRISNTENKKISLLNDQTTVPISREKKINRGFKI